MISNQFHPPTVLEHLNFIFLSSYFSSRNRFLKVSIQNFWVHFSFVLLGKIFGSSPRYNKSLNLLFSFFAGEFCRSNRTEGENNIRLLTAWGLREEVWTLQKYGAYISPNFMKSIIYFCGMMTNKLTALEKKEKTKRDRVCYINRHW
jgi:hypothetical protein